MRCEAAGMKAWEQDVRAQRQVSETVTVIETIPLVTITEATDATTLDALRIDSTLLLTDISSGFQNQL